MSIDPRELAMQYLREGRVMSLSTVAGNQPRSNSIYYVASADMLAVYWLSLPSRRHSRAIAGNSKVGGSIAIKIDQPVAGLQFTGEAGIVKDTKEIKAVLERYNEKYTDVQHDLYEKILAGTNKHVVYFMEVQTMELFDEVNFPGGEVIAIGL